MTHDARGFTLVEALVAVTILMALLGALFAIAAPAQGLFQSQPERADMEQRLRVAVDTLHAELRTAGAGISSVSAARGPLSRVVASVFPYRIGQSRGDPQAGRFYRSDAISMIAVPSSSGQARIVAVARAGPSLLIDVAPNCGAGAVPTDLCGFSSGGRVMLLHPSGRWAAAIVVNTFGTTVEVESELNDVTPFNDGRAVLADVVVHSYQLREQDGVSSLMHYDGRVTDLPVVDDVVDLRFDYLGDPMPPRLLPGADLVGNGPWTTYGPAPPPIGHDDESDAWPAGESCAFAVVDGVHVPRLTALPAAAGASVPLAADILTDGPWCPDAAASDRYDADLLRIRGVHVTLRVQVASPAFRGPAGRLFARPGRASSAAQWVPDQAVEFDVAPRNLNADR